MSESVPILHVDDDRAFCELVVEFLERHNLTVVTEHTATDGLDRLDASDVECIVSDYDMPGMDGLEFLEAVRERDPDLPFILFTGRGNEEVASDAISAGVSDYLQKGGSREQYELLANRIHNYVEQYRAHQAVADARRRYELAGKVSSDVIYEHDILADESIYTEGLREIFGYDPDAVGSLSWWVERIHPEDRDAVLDQLRTATAATESSVSLEYRIRLADGTYRFISEDRHIEYDESGDPTRVFGAFRDVTERRRREEHLDSLHEASRALIGATSVERAVETVSEAAEAILDLPINAVFLQEGDRLVPAAYTDRTAEVLGAVPELPRGEAIMWTVFETGDPVSYADVRECEDRFNPDTPIRSELYAPIGRFGVFVAASTTVDDFTESDVDLSQLLAANLEAALDRLDA